MAKTVFSSGVVITSKWLNGSQSISFDGADEDWHYPPLTANDIKISGEGGFDSAFVTLGTTQTIDSVKVFSNRVDFDGTEVTGGLTPLEASGNSTYWNTLVGNVETKLGQFGDGVVTGTVLLESVLTIDGGEVV